MDREALRELLQALRKGRLSVAQAMEALAHLPYEQLSMAKVDHHRALRQGIPEVVLAQGKAPEDAAEIARALYARAGRVLITKASEEVFRALDLRGAKFYPRSGVIAAGARAGRKGRVVVVSAGTADAPVAEEAALTASFLGSRTQCLDDVGVAGLHRLLQHLKLLRSARALVVVAGMEGALPSVVGALVEAPVVAVPTSTGYGASLGGLAALLAMLNACVPGVAVVNIDNGFGAGCLAHKINIQASKRP
jgi:hypothetical protein